MAYVKRAGFTFLMAVMSFYCMMTTDTKYFYATVITLVVGGLMGWFCYPTVREYLWPYGKEHIGIALFTLLWAERIAQRMMLHNIPRAQAVSVLPLGLFRWYGYALAGIGIWVCLMMAVRLLANGIPTVWNHVDQKVRREFLCIGVIFSLLVVVCYTAFPGWYTQFDRIYSVDTSSLLMNLYGNPEFLEAPHPLYGIVSYPISVLAMDISEYFVPSAYDSLVFALVIQLICIQTVLWSGLLLHVMTKHRYIFLLYCCSNAVMFYCLALEKYQIATFLVVLYMYLRSEKKVGSDTALVLAGGTMFTSFWAGVMELLQKESWKTKLLRVGRIIIWTLGITVASGHFLFFHQELLGMFQLKEAFAKPVPMVGRMQSILWMIHSGFMPIDATMDGGFVIWRDVNSGWSVIGGSILLIALLGFIVKYRDTLAQGAFAWILMAFLLFGPMNWCVTETPLFNIYFHWAIVLLFVFGADWLLKKLRLKPQVVYPVLSGFLLVISVIDYIRIMQGM